MTKAEDAAEAKAEAAEAKAEEKAEAAEAAEAEKAEKEQAKELEAANKSQEAEQAKQAKKLDELGVDPNHISNKMAMTDPPHEAQAEEYVPYGTVPNDPDSDPPFSHAPLEGDEDEEDETDEEGVATKTPRARKK